MINCTFENGNKASLRHTVVDAIVIRDDKILLIKRAKHITNGGKWAIPGGFVDRDETCEEAAIRELKEETNLTATSTKLFKVNDNPNRRNEDRQNIAFVYAMKAEGELIAQESEVDDIKWFDISDLPKAEDFAFDHLEIIKEYLSHIKAS